MRTRDTPTRRRRWLTFLPLLAVLIAAGIFVVANRSQAISPTGTPVTLDSALADYRAHPGAQHDDIGFPDLPIGKSPDVKGFSVPAPGVYTYRSIGKDSIIYNGDSYERPFPATSYATVRQAGGCVWELAFTPIKEHTDAHRQCSAPGEYLCLAHMQKVSFAGIEGDEQHKCDPAMVQVGGKATKPGGREETVCVSHGNRARIVIKYIAEEPVTVDGVPRPAHHVQIDSFVNGDGLEGTAVADAWFDVQDGLYLKMIRSADVHVDRGGGNKGTYHVEATYDLISRTPQV